MCMHCARFLYIMYVITATLWWARILEKVPLQQMDSDMYQDMKYNVNKRQLSRSELHLSKTKSTDATDKSSIPFKGRQC